MKFSRQTKDGAIDNLLRAYVSRPSNPNQVCPDFDADRANAYIERGLTGAVRLQYEAHLSECAGCRKSVVALLRMAEADSLSTVTFARQEPKITRLSRLKEMFGALSQPQWAMAAAAVIVFAVSLPLFLSRNQTQEARQGAADQSVSERSAVTPAESSPSSTAKAAEATAALVSASKQRESGDVKIDALAKNSPAAIPAPESAAGFAGVVEPAKKAETKSAVESEEAQRKSESVTVAQAPAQTGAAAASQAGRTDADQARQQQQTEKDAAQQVAEPKLAARSNEDRSKEKTQRAEEIAPPPAPPADDGRGRSRMARPGGHALRDSDSADAVRPEERKFNGKRFLLRDGAWTDKDFDPNKDLPVVIIIRDSNVYKEVLNKRPGLKPFLTGFQPGERAIIVYKGTVYRLIPQ